MAILEGIQIKNFRALKDVTLGRVIKSRSSELPRLAAVIGANGTGKSSLLDAIGFLGDCLTLGVEAACDESHRGGFRRLRTQGSTGPIEFEIRYREGEESPINYTLHIDAQSNGMVYVARERLRHRPLEHKKGQPLSFIDLKNGSGSAWLGGDQRKSDTKPIKMSDKQSLAISTLGALADHPQIGQFREFLGRWYLSYFDPAAARGQPMSGAQPHLNRKGGNIANYLQFIYRKRPAKFKLMLQRIGKKIPGIQRINFDETEDGRLLLQFFSAGYARPFYQRDMSDGTLKLLAYMLLMEDPDPSPLVGIEEPENGLHHQLLETLAQEFKSFAAQSRGPQILITTHSPNFVDALAPNEVWILDKNTLGHSTLTRAADIPGVSALFQEGLPMGSLWYSDHFGRGNP